MQSPCTALGWQRSLPWQQAEQCKVTGSLTFGQTIKKVDLCRTAALRILLLRSPMLLHDCWNCALRYQEILPIKLVWSLQSQTHRQYSALVLSSLAFGFTSLMWVLHLFSFFKSYRTVRHSRMSERSFCNIFCLAKFPNWCCLAITEWNYLKLVHS